jgi:hypothetical protein
MLKKFKELLARIGSESPPTAEELDAAFEEILEASDEDIAEVRSELVDMLVAAVDNETPDLEAGKALKAAIDKVDSTIASRVKAGEETKAAAAELLKGLKSEGSPGDESEEAPAGEEPVEDAEAKAKELVGVGASILSTRSRIVEHGKVTPRSDVVIAAIGPAAGSTLRQDASLEDVARVFASNATKVQTGRHSLIRLDKQYPEDRKLGQQRNESNRLIELAFAPEAVAAAGGICPPLEADFAHPVIGDRARPIRNALGQFQADTGGVRYSPAITLADITSGVALWTHETDASPGLTTKDCGIVDCEEELTALVDAVYACLQIGNFQAKFSPQLWRAHLEAVMILHDRIAEQNLLGQIQAGADGFVLFNGGTSTVANLYNGLDKLVAGIKSRLRLVGRGTAILAIVDQFIINAVRAAITNQRLTAGAPADQLAVSEQQITSFFTARGVTPIYSPDVDVFGAQTAGTAGSPVALAGWGAQADPTETTLTIFPADSWFFLDGGTLDLGTEIRDSTLNAQNNRQSFVETFEGVAQRGPETYVATLTLDESCICPDVEAAA